MKIVTWKTQQMSQTYLFMNSEYPWKLLVVIHLGIISRMKGTTEAYKIW